MSPLLDSPLTESRHETRTDTTRTPGALSGTDGSNPAPSSGESKTNPSRPPRCGASKSIVLIAVLSAVPRDRLAWLNGRTRASSAASCPAGLADNYIISTRWACPPKSNVP